MPRIIIYPYKMSSQSSSRLSNRLREVGHTTFRVYPNKRYQPQPDDFIINWGNSTLPTWGHEKITLNKTEAIQVSSNKLLTFARLDTDQIPHPACTTDLYEVESWQLANDIVFARHLMSGHSGRGIEIIQPFQAIPPAPLYTLEFKKTNEYRIHVFKDDILDIQEKKKRNGTGSRYDSYVWNHSNNFVFCREGIEVPWEVQDAALAAVQALGLDFGAVDVGYNKDTQETCVFEVNSAPGIEGTTLNKYVEKINGLVSSS